MRCCVPCPANLAQLATQTLYVPWVAVGLWGAGPIVEGSDQQPSQAFVARCRCSGRGNLRPWCHCRAHSRAFAPNANSCCSGGYSTPCQVCSSEEGLCSRKTHSSHPYLHHALAQPPPRFPARSLSGLSSAMATARSLLQEGLTAATEAAQRRSVGNLQSRLTARCAAPACAWLFARAHIAAMLKDEPCPCGALPAQPAARQRQQERAGGAAQHPTRPGGWERWGRL